MTALEIAGLMCLLFVIVLVLLCIALVIVFLIAVVMDTCKEEEDRNR